MGEHEVCQPMGQKSYVWLIFFINLFSFLWSMVILLVEMKENEESGGENVKKEEMEGKWWRNKPLTSTGKKVT
jgi:hypothetical protein